ncbi:MAG: restriction endonuclease, partial [Chlorobiaceae bacterium]|nr:restriction endonuclease [Chlorobiaceae bacterium]
DTGQTKFLVSGMLTTETEEIERAILTSKLEKAKPFFEFKAIKKVDWSKLKDDKGEYFEKLTETLLPLEQNLADIKSIGTTNSPDRGRDFIVTENIFDTFGSLFKKKWLVQCKYSDKSISPRIIPDWVNRTVGT